MQALDGDRHAQLGVPPAVHHAEAPLAHERVDPGCSEDFSNEIEGLPCPSGGIVHRATAL